MLRNNSGDGVKDMMMKKEDFHPTAILYNVKSRVRDTSRDVGPFLSALIKFSCSNRSDFNRSLVGTQS
jgi:hypothetical protein